MKQTIYLLILLILPLFDFGQTDSTKREANIIKNILGDKKESKQFNKSTFMHQLDAYLIYYTESLSNDESRSTDSFYVSQERKNILNYADRNIFESDSILTVDSSLIISLIHQYDAMVKLNRVIGIRKYLHFDLSASTLKQELLATRDFSSFEKELWGQVDLLLDNFNDKYVNFNGSFVNPPKINTDSLIFFGEQLLVEIKSIREVNLRYWKVNRFAYVKAAFTWEESESHYDSVITKLDQFISFFREIPSQTVIMSDTRKRAYEELYLYAYDQINFFDRQITSNEIDKKYVSAIAAKDYADFSLFNLLIINRYIHYDSSWVNFKSAELQSWLKDVGIDTLLHFNNIRLDENGNFNVNFYIPSQRNASDKNTWYNFRKKYQSKSKQEFTDMLFLKLGNFLRLPSEMIIMNISYFHTWESYTFSDNEINVSMSFLTSGSSETRIKNFDVNGIAGHLTTAATASVKPRAQEVSIEKLVYEALKKYFLSRHIPIDDNIQRIKMEDNEVKIFLNNTRKEVLRMESFWENVQYDFLPLPGFKWPED